MISGCHFLIDIPAVIRDAEHLGLWWRFGFCIALFDSLKGVWKISLSSWLPESPLCLEFLSVKPTQVNGLRAAVINNPTRHLNVSLKLHSKNEKSWYPVPSLPGK